HEPGFPRRHGRLPQQAQARLEGPLVKRRLLLRRMLALLAGSVLLPNAAAVETTALPGGIARIRLGKAAQPPVVRLGDTRVLVMREGGQWSAIVGVPLLAEAGSVLSVDIDGGRESAHIVVGAKKYAE